MYSSSFSSGPKLSLPSPLPDLNRTINHYEYPDTNNNNSANEPILPPLNPIRNLSFGDLDETVETIAANNNNNLLQQQYNKQYTQQTILPQQQQQQQYNQQSMTMQYSQQQQQAANFPPPYQQHNPQQQQRTQHIPQQPQYPHQQQQQSSQTPYISPVQPQPQQPYSSSANNIHRVSSNSHRDVIIRFFEFCRRRITEHYLLPAKSNQPDYTKWAAVLVRVDTALKILQDSKAADIHPEIRETFKQLQETFSTEFQHQEKQNLQLQPQQLQQQQVKGMLNESGYQGLKNKVFTMLEQQKRNALDQNQLVILGQLQQQLQYQKQLRTAYQQMQERQQANNIQLPLQGQHTNIINLNNIPLTQQNIINNINNNPAPKERKRGGRKASISQQQQQQQLQQIPMVTAQQQPLSQQIIYPNNGKRVAVDRTNQTQPKKQKIAAEPNIINPIAAIPPNINTNTIIPNNPSLIPSQQSASSIPGTINVPPPVVVPAVPNRPVPPSQPKIRVYSNGVEGFLPTISQLPAHWQAKSGRRISELLMLMKDPFVYRQYFKQKQLAIQQATQQLKNKTNNNITNTINSSSNSSTNPLTASELFSLIQEEMKSIEICKAKLKSAPGSLPVQLKFYYHQRPIYPVVSIQLNTNYLIDGCEFSLEPSSNTQESIQAAQLISNQIMAVLKELNLARSGRKIKWILNAVAKVSHEYYSKQSLANTNTITNNNNHQDQNTAQPQFPSNPPMNSNITNNQPTNPSLDQAALLTVDSFLA